MKIKTTELTGAALDWAVAKCERITVSFTPPEPSPRLIGVEYEPPYDPHSNWNIGGPIIEREKIAIDFDHDCWNASVYREPYYLSGATPLEAAMRAYVASKLGDEVEIPSQLTN